MNVLSAVLLLFFLLLLLFFFLVVHFTAKCFGNRCIKLQVYMYAIILIGMKGWGHLY